MSILAAVPFASGAAFDTVPTQGMDRRALHLCHESPTQDIVLGAKQRPTDQKAASLYY